MAARRVKGQEERAPKATSGSKPARARNGRTVKGPETTAVSATPTTDEIRLRAYQIYVERGAAHGLDWNDWFVAERQLMASRSSPS
jgi:hypothetical protein